MAQKAGINASTLTSEQLQQARSALGGRDPSTLSAAEIAAAKQALGNAQTKNEATPSSPDSSSRRRPSTLLGDASMFPDDTLGIDSLELADSLFRTPVVDSFQRYENMLFASVLPSIFYDRQGSVSAEYPVKPDDQLVLSLWGAVEKEYPLKVNSQGKVFVEGIGLVSLNGLTLGRAEQTLRSKLTAVYAGIGQGRISVNLRPESIAANKVFVVGDVKRPGGYDLPAGANVFLALYRAMGPNAIGSVRQIKVQRGNSGDSLVVDLYELLFKGKKVDQAVLRDGDMVFVPRAEKLVKVQGDVGRPAIYELKGEEGVREALAFAGNVNPTAGHTLSLWRLQADGRWEVNDLAAPKEYGSQGKNEVLYDGDSLVVRTATVESRDFVEVLGAVWYPGMYKHTTGLNVRQAVDLAGGLTTDGYGKRVVVRRILPDSSFQYLGDSYEQPIGLPLLPKDRLIVLSEKDLNANKKVRISGAVKQVVEVEWQPGLSVKSMMALAGGFTMNHLKGRVRIERLLAGKEEVVVLERTIRDDLGLEERDDLLLEPGDRVVVPVDPEYYEQELVTLYGAVRNPGSYALVKTRETVTDFVKRVVVFDDNAFLKGGRLYRKRGTGYYLVNFDFAEAAKGALERPVTLMQGDSIYIPEEQLTVQIKGEVVSPGDVLWNKGWDVDDYINAAGGLTATGDEERIVVTYANGRKSNSERAEDDPDPGSIIEIAYLKPSDPIKWTEVISAFGTIITGIAAFVIAYATLSGKT